MEKEKQQDQQNIENEKATNDEDNIEEEIVNGKTNNEEKSSEDKISELDNVGEVEVELIWDPPWTIDRMSDDARLALDIG